MGLEPFLVNSTIIGTVAQRLVRKICPDCKEEYTPEEWMLDLSEKLKGKKFYTSWGYDQTNTELMKVLEVSPSGKSAKCRRVKATVKPDDSHMTYNMLSPTDEEFGDVFRMMIHSHTDGDGITEYHLRGSYPYCIDGSMEHKMLGNAYYMPPGKTAYQTDSQFGH